MSDYWIHVDVELPAYERGIEILRPDGVVAIGYLTEKSWDVAGLKWPRHAFTFWRYIN